MRDDQPPQGVESPAPPRPLLLRPRRGGTLPMWGHGLRHHGLYRRAMGTSRSRIRASGRQPGAAAGRPQRRRRRPGAERGRRAPRLGRGARGAAAAGRRGRHRRGPRAGPARQRAPPRADVVRPLRQPDRRGRVPPGLALADGARGRPRAGRDAVGAAGRRRSRRAPAPRGRLPGLVAHRARPRLPDLDDLRRDPGAARRRRAGQGVDAAARLHDLRPRPPAGEREARRAVRHGHDREAGRLRRPRQRHRGAAAAGRQLHPARPQVVHLRADERRLPGARPGGRRRDLLRGAAGAARRHPQPARRRTPQGQARQPVQRLVRARVRRHRRAAARRRGPRRPDHHRDGRRHPARLRARLGRADAARGVRGVVARRPPLGVRLAAGRQAADAERRRRPGRRVRGRHGAGAAARLGRRRPGRGPARGRAAADRAAAGEVLGLQAHARRSPPRRWSAWAATATSRSR